MEGAQVMGAAIFYCNYEALTTKTGSRAKMAQT